ncbi:WxL domain-containing protein [Lactiplantibacillus sp. WILCCON 0030]|uniref:WxL domain-containing protein n=1 Tax=Lactiplantibacillus brownii TaxID=3069269 RepID=A0ABU1AB32_9LACO|nr:WxL domain-containing protein [Lactiplantibacillus brownii]MDQ7938098.1 WxL domain-containing protein [Lactiplantibacillus brownii]
MKKASKHLLAVGAILSLGLVLSTTQANAAPAPSKPEVQTSTDTTEATVTLKQSEKEGAIKIEQTPVYHFDNLEISAFSKDYTATSVEKNLTISNPGFESGYNVAARITDFIQKAGTRKGDPAASKLNGADFSITTGTIAAVEAGNLSGKPETFNDIHLNNTDTIIMNATAGNGLGRYSLTHDKSAVKLGIPGGNKVGSYKATITWTLRNVPA